jgi:SAM-dependent methyltransferase
MERPPDTYMHGHHESVLRSHRWRTAENSAAYVLPELVAGRRVLDVGCGPGTVTLDFCRLVAPGVVVAIDRDAGVLEAARADAVEQRVTNVTYEEGDVYALAFPDASFDVVHAHQLLQHLSDPVAALAEMRRVCAPGGVVAARDSDYAAFTWFPPDADLTRWLALYHDVARANRAEPDAGRRLLAWAHAAGFDDVRASASVWCYSAPEERAWWGDLWADRVVASAFAEQAVGFGLSTASELGRLSAAWRRWATTDDGWFAILHGEVLCRV